MRKEELFQVLGKVIHLLDKELSLQIHGHLKLFWWPLDLELELWVVFLPYAHPAGLDEVSASCGAWFAMLYIRVTYTGVEQVYTIYINQNLISELNKLFHHSRCKVWIWI